MEVCDDVRYQYAPTGKLRVALNHGNSVLVGRTVDGHPYGISVDLARALGEELGLEPVFMHYERAVDVSSSAEADEWDVCFLAVDPERATVISFTDPYVRIEGCYLVPAHSNATASPEVVEKALRIATVRGSAYSLHLARRPGAEHLVIKPDIKGALAALDGGTVDGIAGIRQAMEAESALRPGSRVLDPPFMEIRQAMGVPAGRARAHAHLQEFIAARARDGSIGAILERHGVSAGCAIVPDTEA